MKISDEELSKERIPLAARDYCAHLLVNLNRCRRQSLYSPFHCGDEKHSYEQCLYQDFLRRRRQLQQLQNQNEKVTMQSTTEINHDK